MNKLTVMSSSSLFDEFLSENVILLTGGNDEADSAGMVMWDLQKALDTVNHDIFPTKLRALGFNGTIVQ